MFMKKNKSYKLDLTININHKHWVEILRKIFPLTMQKDESAVFEFLCNVPLECNDSPYNPNPPLFKIGKYKEYGSNEKYYFFIKERSFRYVEFYFGASSLTQIWSDYHKTFVNNTNINNAPLFNAHSQFYDTYRSFFKEDLKEDEWKFDNSNRILITPSFVAIAPVFPDFATDEQKIGKNPFDDIRGLISNIHNNSGDSMQIIKKFPNIIQQKLNAYGVQYDIDDYDYRSTESQVNKTPDEEFNQSKWAKKVGVELYEKRIKQHILRQKFFDVYFNLEYFE